jgi:DNA-binding HxlR family transcriptional regulator/putative sterol carrier protein
MGLPEGSVGGVSGRRYAQFCFIARALDAVGDRWTLLVVRELLEGPRRYTDLMEGLPGIATDMLATRLRDLERTGVISKRTLPPPAGARVYELTELGRELEPVMRALTVWGTRLPDGQQHDDAFQARWLVHPLRTMFRPEKAAGTSLSVRFDVDGDTLDLTVDDGTLATVDGELAVPDVVVTASAETLGAVLADPRRAARAVADGRLRTNGTARALGRFRAVFGLDARTARQSSGVSRPARR